MEFKNRLIALMQERNYTQYRLSRLLNCQQTAVANWVYGRNIPHHKTMVQIAEVFGVSVDYLKGITDIREETPIENDERLLPADFTAQYWALSDQGRAELARYAQYLRACETKAVDFPDKA